MTSAENYFFDDPGYSRFQEQEQAQSTRVQSLYGVMTERAMYHATTNRGGNDLNDISLLHEALANFGLTIDDLSDEELQALSDLEGYLFQEHLIDTDSNETAGTVDGYPPDDPRFWETLHERLKFKEVPDPNQAIKTTLASEAFIDEVLNNKDATYLIKKPDGTITEESRGEQ